MLTGPLLFLLAGLLVVVASAAVVARLRLAGVVDRVVAFGTLAVTQIELSLLVSGAAFDSLRRPTLVAVNAVLTAAALLYGGRALRASIGSSDASRVLLNCAGLTGGKTAGKQEVVRAAKVRAALSSGSSASTITSYSPKQ